MNKNHFSALLTRIEFLVDFPQEDRNQLSDDPPSPFPDYTALALQLEKAAELSELLLHLKIWVWQK